MQSLYSICLHTMANHAEHIVNWSHIPFDPFVLDMMQVLGEKEKSPIIKAAIYENIGAAHGHHLPNHLGAVSLMGRGIEALQKTSQTCPRFITHLNLSFMDGINDSSLLLLKPCIHLQVLEMSSTQITDRGVSHLARMATLGDKKDDENRFLCFGFNHLQILGLANNAISDVCLKHLCKIPSLVGVDVSYTSITDIAIQFMKQHQFEILYAVSPPPTHQSSINPSSLRSPLDRCFEQNDDQNHLLLITWWGGIHSSMQRNDKRSGVEYLLAQQKNPGFNIKLNPNLFKILGEPLIPSMRQRRRSVHGSYFGDLCFVRRSISNLDEKKKIKKLSAPTIEEPRRKRLRIIKEASPSPPPPLPARKQSWPNAMDYLKMIEKDLGI